MKVVIALSVACLAVTAVPVLGQVLVYSNDFEGAVGSEWSQTATDVTPIGARRFLGEFCSESVSLALGGLQPHVTLTVNFDLFIIASMDGNCVINLWDQHVGPDIWGLTIDGSSILHTTFSNLDDTPGWSQNQAYPETYPGGDFPPTTGAVESETLGFQWHDSVYHLAFAVPHSDESALIRFTGDFQDVHTGYEGLGESWGLDNVQVRVTVPEPSAILALLFGLGGVVLQSRRKK